MKHKLKKILAFLTNPRLLVCLAIAWMITNGWSYVLFALGGLLEIGWMTAVGGAWLAFLWLPVSPEKLVTVAIAIALLRLLFPRDEKTLAVLREMCEKGKKNLRDKGKKGNNKREDRCENDPPRDEK